MRPSCAVGLVAAIGACAALRADVVPSSPLFLSPQPDPGHPGQTIQYVLWYVVHPDGHVALNAELQPFGSLNHGAYIPRAGLPPVPIARTNEQAAGAPAGQVYSYFYWNVPVVTDGTTTAFRNRLLGPGTTESNRWALFVGAPGGMTLEAREGSPAPEAGPNAVFGLIGNPINCGPGRIAFATKLTDPGVPSSINSAIWTWSGGQRVPIAMYNQPAPGAGGGLFGSLTNPDETLGFDPPPNPMVANRAGLLAFQTRLQVGPKGVWTHTPTQGLRLAALQDTTTFTGMNPAVKLGDQSRPALNDAGQIAMRCYLSGPSPLVTNITDTAVIIGTPVASPGSGPTHAFRVVSREGDQVPGRDPSWKMAPFHFSSSDNNRFGNPSINSSGSVAFAAEVRDPTGNSQLANGIFRDRGLGLETLAASGDIIPDRQIQLSITIFNPAISDTNDVAFLAGQSNMSGITGLFAHVDGAMRTIALVGDQVQVSPGSFRTISSLWNSGNGFPSPDLKFDANHQLYYWARFVDGSTAILVTTVPSPSGLCLLAMSGLLLRRQRPGSPV